MKLFRPHRLGITLMLGCAVQPFAAGAINSAQIIASALSPQCLEYKIVGICYWLLCTPYGCTVKTSTKVRHYIPNAVVSSYNQTGRNPWTEMSFLGTGLSGIAEGEARTSRNALSGKITCNLKIRMLSAIRLWPLPSSISSWGRWDIPVPALPRR